MIFRRKKIRCDVGPAPNPETVEFFFYGDHWSIFFPNVKRILRKGLKPCRFEAKTEAMITYEVGTDDVHHTLLCEDGEVHINDNNYGLWVFVAKNNRDLIRRVKRVLEASGRFDVICESKRKEEVAPNKEDAPGQKAAR
jgi:hypothetical protein